MVRAVVVAWVLALAAAAGRAIDRPPAAMVRGDEAEYFHVEGNTIRDTRGRVVVLTGVNWFGLETSAYAPHGLWARNWQDVLDQIRQLGFNTIRLPYSNQLLDSNSVPNGVDHELNPDLEGLTGLQIMDRIVEGAGQRGLKVILDRHRPGSAAQSDLWYTDAYDEERWIEDWTTLAQRYADDDTVIGVDLHNEPHGRVTWGTGSSTTDWRLAAQRAGNAILEVNPRLLIIVQGVDQYQGDWYWWGGNLMGVRDSPVELTHPEQLVYSTHEYGPGVYPQPWFWDPTFPDNLPELWDRHWAYVSREGIAPVIVGEFGGRSVGDDREGIWQRSLVSFLRQNNLSYFYWTINPNSADTGGLLLEDWTTADPAKLALLSGYQFPLLGIEEMAAGGVRPPPDFGAGGLELRVRYRTPNPAALAHDSKPEFIVSHYGSVPVSLSDVELRYWFSETSGQRLVFHCDWAAMGCGRVAGEFVDAGGGLHYLRLSFRQGLPALVPGDDTGEIKVRFNREDWSPYLQTYDYSFGSWGEYREWPRVGLYVQGQLVWGTEPGAETAAGDLAMVEQNSEGDPSQPPPGGVPSPAVEQGSGRGESAGQAFADDGSDPASRGDRAEVLDGALLALALATTAYGLSRLLRLLQGPRA